MKKIATLQLLVLLALNSWCYANELKSITLEQFFSQSSSPERRQIVQFVSDQFKEADRTKLNQKTFDEIWANEKLRNSLHLARIKIINQKLYADSFDFNNHRFQTLIRHIEKLTKLFELKNLDFLIILRDEILKQDSSEKEFKQNNFFNKLLNKL